MTTFFSAGTGATGIRHELASRLLRTWYLPLSRSPLKPLLPLLRLGARFYATGLERQQLRARLKSRRLPCFVISIGNLVAGGTGKTPLTLWLAAYLQRKGLEPAILSRGYGRKSGETARVPTAGETFSQTQLFGDEPVLMAQKNPAASLWVGRNRYASGLSAMETSGAQVLLMDDGFQHLALERNMDLVLLDAGNPFGNGSLLPLGPLREPVTHLQRADAIILSRAHDPLETSKTRSLLMAQFPGKPVFACRHRLAGLRAGLRGPLLHREGYRNQPAVAFAGIARPEAFFKSLKDLDIDLHACLGFPDHHAYSRADADMILTSVRKTGARYLVTTQKDFVRFPAEIQSLLVTAELELDFGTEEKAFCRYLDGKISRQNG